MIRHKGLVIASIALVALVATGIWLTGSSGGTPSKHGLPEASKKNSSKTTATSLVAVAPATTIPALTSVQMQYDQAFQNSFSANSQQNAQVLALSLPSPAIGGGWPNLPIAETPESWAASFVVGLLDINFSGQSRASLGSWLEAEEAPEDLPGLSAELQNRTLYVSLLEPGITQQSSPIPSAAIWNSNAASGVVWSVNGLKSSVDPNWQKMIDAGWQPRDLRMTTLDVSGFLGVTQNGVTTEHLFSMTLVVGSAQWHNGYGSVLVGNWSES